MVKFYGRDTDVISFYLIGQNVVYFGKEASSINFNGIAWSHAVLTAINHSDFSVFQLKVIVFVLDDTLKRGVG